MDNSSSRIGTLLKIAFEEEEESADSPVADDAKVIRYVEEQTSDDIEPVQQESTPLVQVDYQCIKNKYIFNGNSMNMFMFSFSIVTETLETTCSSVCKAPAATAKRSKPEFIMEIIAEEEEFNTAQQMLPSSIKKLKLSESPRPSSCNSSVDSSCRPNDVSSLSQTSSQAGDQQVEDDSNLSISSTFSPRANATTYICHRVKRKKHASAPKRLKLV